MNLQQLPVALLPSIHEIIPSSECPCSLPLLMLTGNNVVSCQDLRTQTNATGYDMYSDNSLLHKVLSKTNTANALN